MKSLLLLFAIILIPHTKSFGQTNGTLTVSFTTSSAGGNYSPKNIVAIWIEDKSGDYVKTLMAYANSRKTHLNKWQASTTAAGSAYNTIDAITGSTRSNHTTRTCNWNGRDFNGNLVDDGAYTVWFELTDKNGTGNYSSFNFSKGSSSVTKTPSNVPSFSSISINWIPGLTEIVNYDTHPLPIVYPNPTSGNLIIENFDANMIEIRSIKGDLINRASPLELDMSNLTSGIYIIHVFSENKNFSQKIIKE